MYLTVLSVVCNSYLVHRTPSLLICVFNSYVSNIGKRRMSTLERVGGINNEKNIKIRI